MTLTTPGDGATYVRGAPIVAQYTCDDDAGGTGLASCTGTVPRGARIATDRAGANAFTVTAIDGAGNTTTRTVHYTVRALGLKLGVPARINLAGAARAFSIGCRLTGARLRSCAVTLRQGNNVVGRGKAQAAGAGRGKIAVRVELTAAGRRLLDRRHRLSPTVSARAATTTGVTVKKTAVTRLRR